LRTAGAGRWADSGGYRSKFGISLPELIELVGRPEGNGGGHEFVLLHFHLGSQISDIQRLKQAAKEVAQIYADLIKRGMPIRYLDVGGGLGVNYSGGFEEGSINYSLQEYANAVVSAIGEVCDSRDVPHPVLISESGRAMTAHHSMLVVETVGAFQKDSVGDDYQMPPDAHRMTRNLGTILDWLRSSPDQGFAVEELLECYHEVVEVHREAATLFGMGAHVLEQLRGDPQAFARGRTGSAVAGAVPARGEAGRSLSDELLGVSVNARPLGHSATVPDHAVAATRRATDPARAAG
jgi:arginine decarboxylase